MPPEILARDLAALKPIVHFKVIQLVGGEPTLHKNIVQMIEVARASGVGDSVCVITNGHLLPRMSDDFWKAVDWIQLSIYPRLDPKIIEYAKAKCAEFNKPFYSTVFTDFHQQLRATTSDGSNFTNCHWKTNCFTVHDGFFALCPQSLFFPKNFMGLDQFVDCLPLEGITEDKLQAFLDRKEPFNACRICAANEMRQKPWSETKDKAAWQAASTLTP